MCDDECEPDPWERADDWHEEYRLERIFDDET